MVASRASHRRYLDHLLLLSVYLCNKSGTAGPSTGPGLIVTLFWSLFHTVFPIQLSYYYHTVINCVLGQVKMKHEFVRGDKIMYSGFCMPSSAMQATLVTHTEQTELQR